MSLELDHTIVPVADKWASARFFAAVFAVQVRGEAGPQQAGTVALQKL